MELLKSAGNQPKTMRQWLPSTQAAHKQLISDNSDSPDNSESQSHPNTLQKQTGGHPVNSQSPPVFRAPSSNGEVSPTNSCKDSLR